MSSHDVLPEKRREAPPNLPGRYANVRVILYVMAAGPVMGVRAISTSG